MSVVEAACLGRYGEVYGGRVWGDCAECGWYELCFECAFIIPSAGLEELPEHLISIYPKVREIAKKRMEEIRGNESTNC